MKRKTKSGIIWLLVLALTISVSATTTALVSRIHYYTQMEDVSAMIPLIPDLADLDDIQITTVSRTAARALSPVNVTYCAPVEDTKFTVSDDKSVWGTNTPVDIFRTSYENGEGKIILQSSNGDKIIAPGTENSYTFKLKNTHTLPADYSVTVKAYVTPGDLTIPVECRLSRQDGAWVAGDETTWLGLEEFDGAQDNAILSPRSYIGYTLDWQWPYEGSDELDTILGQRAMEEDVKLTIEIITTATLDNKFEPEPEPEPMPDPENPTVPDVETPESELPLTPGTPVEPGTEPGDPGTPGTPGTEPGEDDEEIFVEPEEENPEVGTTLPPETGDAGNPTLLISMAALSFVLLLILLLWEDGEDKRTGTEGSKRD